MGLNDYALDMSFFGFLLGGYVGYVLRPAVNAYGYYGKVSAIDLYFYASGLGYDLNPYVKSVAMTSIHYIIAGALIGMTLGWILGKNTKKD